MVWPELVGLNQLRVVVLLFRTLYNHQPIIAQPPLSFPRGPPVALLPLDSAIRSIGVAAPQASVSSPLQLLPLLVRLMAMGPSLHLLGLIIRSMNRGAEHSLFHQLMPPLSLASLDREKHPVCLMVFAMLLSCIREERLITPI